ncbi:protein kinase family protein [Dermatophilus congolensis]|uniref:protein kinase family protein n=1 Tax=Dermatophilus congolensis TaxID=1863 RepID=UPI001AAE6AFB|nr:protein kinase family protein [Dermatophilus congolensis]MBO3143892.1 hypothetical protein [Dermatophilus congolensis]MBO3152883.1 hypothetical protein [Dermatophilus congolensis]MBO3160107.1 hypothetical protein [Dermatophilus congolensis]MBO3164168.1 hypothetical protein [Dermatophilus congolensis]MBO3177714.1 hypothetical protein [Dermatophilus congolensis]
MQGVGAGQVVAGRYRLNNRRARIGDIDVWAATDDTLGREVEVTVLPTSHPQAQEIVKAARNSAAIADHRLVRVLDVGSDIRMSWVVEESLADMRTLAQLLETGPLPPEEGRRIAGEIATALTTAARRNVHHLHLTPHAIRITDSGLVKIAGLAVADAIAGGNENFNTEDAQRTDACAIVALMYAAITARWPLPSSIRGLDTAPRVGTAIAVPSELVSAVPPEIDAVCRSTLNHNSGPATPAEVAAQLRPWSSVRVTKASHSKNTEKTTETTPDATPPNKSASSVTTRLKDRKNERIAAERRDLEERRSDPSYLNIREALAVGTGTDNENAIAPGFAAPSYKDGKYARPIVAVVLAGILLATAAAIPVLINTIPESTTSATPTTPAPAKPATPNPSATHTDNSTPIAISHVRSFDPQGDGAENENQTHRATDQNTSSEWHTEGYDSPDIIGGNKRGVGLVLKLQDQTSIKGVKINGRQGQSITVLANNSSSLEGATEIGKVENTPKGESDIRASTTEPAQYLIVLLTKLPQGEDGRYRGSISEITVY